MLLKLGNIKICKAFKALLLYDYNFSLEKDVNYYLDTGLKLEVSKKLDEMYQDGSLKSIINEIIDEKYN